MKLRFTIYAWAKLRAIQKMGDTEVSFLGITSSEDPLLVTDVRMPEQINTYATTEFTEDGLADFFDEMVDAGLHPSNFGRVWCHTHPGKSATPSTVDEKCFEREFSTPNWAVMFIVGTEGETTCRLKFRVQEELHNVVGTHHTKELQTIVDWEADTPAIDAPTRESWKAEYKSKHKPKYCSNPWDKGSSYDEGDNWWNKAAHASSGTSSTGSSQINNNPEYSITVEGSTRNLQAGLYGGVWIWDAEGKSRSWFRDWAEVFMVHHGTGSEFDKLSESDWTNLKNKVKLHGDDGKKSPIGFYQSDTASRKLTKREKKYLKKHGTLEGFVPPVNDGASKVSRNFGEDPDILDAEWTPVSMAEAETEYELDDGTEESDLSASMDKLEVADFGMIMDRLEHLEALEGTVGVSDAEIQEWIELDDLLLKLFNSNILDENELGRLVKYDASYAKYIIDEMDDEPTLLEEPGTNLLGYNEAFDSFPDPKSLT